MKRLLSIPLVLILFACCALAQDRELLPKYGSLPKADWQKAADEKFIAAIDEEYHGDRNKASADLATRGWQYLAAGIPSDAMRRFNQAWLLNSSNGTALWGMAAVEGDFGKFEESLKLFAEAEKYVGDEINFSVDYALMLGTAGVQLKKKTFLKEAFARFESNYQRAPQNTKNLQNWAFTLFNLGKYSEAWSKVKLAEATPNKAALNPQFIEALQSRMPRPPD